MRVELKILDHRLPGWGFPGRGSTLAAGLDLHACLDRPLRLGPGEPATLVPAGFALRIGDPDWCGLITPRSGQGHRGLVLGNGVGVIDADFEGQILISTWNRLPPGAESITVAPGDRIAQLLIVRVGRPNLVTVAAFGEPSARGAGGFGSTGQAGRPQGTG